MNLDITIAVLFLFINLIVGVCNRSKIKTLREYALGNKKLTTSALVASIIAVSYGGEILNRPLSPVEFCLIGGLALGLLIIGRVFTVRMDAFLNKLSVAEMMGDLYGRKIRIIVAISGILCSAGATALQFRVTSKILSLLFELKEPYAIIIAAIIISLYGIWGGMRAVTFIDIVRIFSFGTFIPVLAWLLWKNTVNPAKCVITLLSNFDIATNWGTLLRQYGYLCLTFTIPALYPAQIQRIFMAANVKQAKGSFTYAAVGSFFIFLCLLWVSILLLVNQSSLVIVNFPAYILYQYPGLKGFLGIAVLALSMSTADANMNAGAVLLAHDINKSCKWNFKNEIALVKIANLLMGFFSIYIAFAIQDLLNLLFFTLIVYNTIVTPSLILSILGFRSRSAAVLIGIVVSIITVLYCGYFLVYTEVCSILTAIMANVIGLISSHYLLPKKPNTGWIQVKKKNNPVYLTKSLFLQVFINKFIVRIQQFNLFQSLKDALPKCSLYYLLFSFYVLVTSYCLFFTLSIHIAWTDYLEKGVLFSGLFVATSLVTCVMVQGRSKFILAFLWPISNFYFLFFVGALMVLVSSFDQLHIIILIVNIALSLFVYHWLPVLIMTLIGCGGAIAIFNYFSMPGTHILIEHIQFRFIYVVLLLFIFIGGLIKHKQLLTIFLQKMESFKLSQREYNLRKLYKEQQVDMFYNEGNTVLEIIKRRMLSQVSDTNEALKQHIMTQVNDLKIYFNNVFSYMKHNLDLITNIVNIKDLLDDCIIALKIQNDQDLPYIKMNTQHTMLQCDTEKIKQLLINGIKYCKTNHGKSKDVIIHVRDAQLSYRFDPLQGHRKKIDALAFTIISENKMPQQDIVYKVDTVVPIKVLQKKEHPLLIKNKYIVDFHYGKTEIINTLGHITQVYVIPINVQQVSKAVSVFSIALSEHISPTNVQAIQQEHAFINDVKKHNHLDLATIAETMEIMKKYYGAQLHNSGVLLYTYPLAVTQILLKITTAQNTIIAGLLHGILKHTVLTEAGLLGMFSANITSMVLDAVRLSNDIKCMIRTHTVWEASFIEGRDVCAIQIVLAHTLYKSRTLSANTKQSQATEILQYYAPLAKSIGLIEVTEELVLTSKKILQKRLG